MPHRQLLRTVWGEKAESQAQYLRVYVTHLRKATVFRLETNSATTTAMNEASGLAFGVQRTRVLRQQISHLLPSPSSKKMA